MKSSETPTMNFEHSDLLHLQAAQGWVELGNHLEADKELDEITPALRAHPDVALNEKALI